MNLAVFTFNAFQENTYVLFDESLECAIVDPGCNSFDEEKTLSSFIESKGLKPVLLLNTHCHIDHVLGNKFVADKYRLELTTHKDEKAVLDANVMVANMYGVQYTLSPNITQFLDEGDTATFGNTALEVLLTPGHSPASISFFHKESKQLIAGDVLFQNSIGRTDLPGGDFDTLISSIKTKYYPLGEDVKVYPGHGPFTTIGEEKMNNPFL